MSIKVLIADDHEVVRSGLKTLFLDTDVEVAAEVSTGEAAFKYALSHEVDVVLMDIRMPEGDGLTALGRIKLDKPELPVLMLSTFDNPTYIARSVALGANGYLLKGCTKEQLLQAIHTAAAGEKHLDTRRAAPGDRSPGNPAIGRRCRGPAHPARKRSPSSTGLRPDEQGDRPRAAHQLRDRQGTRAAHPAEDRRLGSHAGRSLGRARNSWSRLVKRL